MFMLNPHHCRFLPQNHVLFKEARDFFGSIPVPARMKLQKELSLDLAIPATALPDYLQTAASPTAVLESLPVVPGPWSFLQQNNQTHSPQLMARERKAWRDKYLSHGRRQQQLLHGTSHPKGRTHVQQHHARNSTTTGSVGRAHPAGLPPRPPSARLARVVPTVSISVQKPAQTGEELEADYEDFVQRQGQRRRGSHEQPVQPAEEDQHVHLEEYDEEYDNMEEEHDEVTQGRAFATLEQVRRDV